jgi:Transglycosylase-like domain
VTSEQGPSGPAPTAPGAHPTSAPRTSRRLGALALGALGALALALAPALTAPAAGAQESGAPGDATPDRPDPVDVYTDLLSGVAVHDAQLAYALSWQADAVQENGLATLAAENAARASFIAAAEETQRLQALQQFLRSRASGGGGASSSGSRCAGDFACFKDCTLAIESHGNYGAVSPGGTYRGAWQFDQTTWDSNASASGRADLVGADPATAASSDQDSIAHDLYQRRGNQPWGGRC